MIGRSCANRLAKSSLQHPRYRVLRGEPDHVGEGEAAEPFGVVAHLGSLWIEDPKRLLLVGRHEPLDLLRGDHGPGRRAAGRIADATREVPHHEDPHVPQVLKLAHLPERDGVSQREVRGGRIDAELDAQRLSRRLGALELPRELLAGDDLCPPSLDRLQGLGGGWLHRVSYVLTTATIRSSGSSSISRTPRAYRP